MEFEQLAFPVLPKQAQLINTTATEVLWGGAAGPGKVMEHAWRALHGQSQYRVLAFTCSAANTKTSTLITLLARQDLERYSNHSLNVAALFSESLKLSLLKRAQRFTSAIASMRKTCTAIKALKCRS